MIIRRAIAVFVVSGLLLLGGAAYVTGFPAPEISPAFAQKLGKAQKHQVVSLIALEAENLQVTALAITSIDSGERAHTLHFGRSEEGAMMQAASLSKTVAAAVIMIQAELSGVGLDDDIRSQISSFDITSLEGGDRVITLRQLLSHTTGASQSGYAGYPREQDVPGLLEVISSPPRFFESALAFDGVPGRFRYSGGGYSIAQLWAQDVSGKDFTQLADELLLKPLGMEHSTFAQPIDDTHNGPGKITGADAPVAPTQGLFSSLTDSWHNYPEQAAAGLWSTSEDYARFALALLIASEGLESPIPSTVAKVMVTPQMETGWKTGEGPTHYGLGTMLKLDKEGAVVGISHTGANAGYRSHFLARPATANTAARVVVSIGNTPSAALLNKAVVYGLNPL
ncbi:hypothetical protein EH31_01130 [Erythrobacter longus]|uniref:Beta-lactamase-related domain-containing protein n=2 Tax=Erythrobacter longus TaxID=1044 RepID=A0A074MCT9_ERYLO|nr:hypothetical protein EH31_01130 [Erythrobacter longus]